MDLLRCTCFMLSSGGCFECSPAGHHFLFLFSFVNGLSSVSVVRELLPGQEVGPMPKHAISCVSNIFFDTMPFEELKFSKRLRK